MMITLKMKYAAEVERQKERILEVLEIPHCIEESSILKMKSGYEEMAAFNQNYSELGIGEDVRNLMLYERGLIEGVLDED